MKQSKKVYAVILTTVVALVVGVVLRIYQLTSCMTPAGLIRVGSPILYVLIGFSVLAAGLLFAFSRGLNGVLGSEKNLTGAPGYLFADLCGAVAVFYGTLQRLLEGDSPFLFVVGMEAALCLAAAALLYGKRSKVSFWLLILPSLFFVALLIFDFKRWSTDPLVIDFCFQLLARICGMLAIFHVSGFVINYGQKRLTVFWAACAVVFAAMLVPDYLFGQKLTLGQLLIPVGLAIWSASHALRLLRPEVQSETAPAEPDPKDTAAPADEVPEA